MIQITLFLWIFIIFLIVLVSCTDLIAPVSNWFNSSSIDKVFQQDGFTRKSLIKELTFMCREIHKKKISYCYGHHTKAFGSFLNGMKLLVSKSNENDFELYEWDLHCSIQEKLNDARTPSVCQAVSYLLVPFPLQPLPNHILDLEKEYNNDKYDDNDHDLELKSKKLSLKVATVISNYKYKNSLTIQSSCLFKIPVTILGNGITNMFQKGLSMKILLLKKFIDDIIKDNYNSNDIDNIIVLFVDGTDTIFQSSEDELKRKFILSKKRIIFSSEHSCFPMKYFPWNYNMIDHKSNEKWESCTSGSCSNSRYICDKLFLNHNNNDKISNRWLNSGAFIGYVKDIKLLLDVAANLPNDILSNWPGADQGLYTHLYLSHAYNIHIDYDTQLFASFGLVNPKEQLNNGITSSNLLIQTNQYHNQNQNDNLTEIGSWYMIRGHTQSLPPSIIHFNADGKLQMGKVHQLLKKYTKKNQQKEATCLPYIHINH